MKESDYSKEAIGCEQAIPQYQINPNKKNISGFEPWIEINTNHLNWNINQVHHKVGQVSIMAVIKCNAYGHGFIGIAQAMQKQGINKFAVGKAIEAIYLRQAGIKGMILNFGGFSNTEGELLVQHGISQSIYSERIGILSEAARKFKTTAKVHIKVDTGLGRVGLQPDEAMAFIINAASMPEIKIEGIFTTLTEEDDVDPIQTEQLLAICKLAESEGITLGIKHVMSSLGLARPVVPLLDMVRIGNCFFGIESVPNFDLKPVMSLKTRIILIKKMHAGETIGYHKKYLLKKNKRIATIPLGYSDGYPLNAVNKSQVLISGRRFPMVGYMSANHVSVDITGDDNIKIGDEVVLFGDQQDQQISIEEVAAWGGISAYHVAVFMNPFLPRFLIP